MTDAPNTRGRHALRWVVGVGLVFVVVVGMALQVARRRADERWASVVEHFQEEWEHYHYLAPGEPVSGGSFFRAWRRGEWKAAGFNLVLRQDRSFFGSSIEARIDGWGVNATAELCDTVRSFLAPVDVQLTLEP